MRTVGSYELKTHLAEVLDAVEHGQTVIVTRHGKPISPPDAKWGREATAGKAGGGSVAPVPANTPAQGRYSPQSYAGGSAVSIVADASVVLAWFFEEAQTPKALDVLKRIEKEGMLIPALWWSELENGILMANVTDVKTFRIRRHF